MLAVADVMEGQHADRTEGAGHAVNEPKDPLLEAFETQQEAVTADPGNFDKWVSLIGAAEKLVRCLLFRIRLWFQLFGCILCFANTSCCRFVLDYGRMPYC